MFNLNKKREKEIDRSLLYRYLKKIDRQMKMKMKKNPPNKKKK